MANTKRTGLARLRVATPGVSALFSVVRELSFDELRDEAMLPPRLLLIGTDQGQLTAVRDTLATGGGGNLIETALSEALPPHLDSFDGIVLLNLPQAERNRPAIQRLLNDVETAGRTLAFQLPPAGEPAQGLSTPEALIDDLRGRLVSRLSHRQLALGRYFPSFRKQAANAVINQTSRANAEFALLSNIPALIPIFGNLMAVGADFLVLTKNQLMLIYKLAALHGRDLTQPWRIYTEMLPIVGSGILWRTVARELTALIPFAAGTIPKVLIAYAGTAVAGQAANFYYLQGERPSREYLQQLYLRASEMARALPLPGRGERRGRDVIEGHFTESRPGADAETAPPTEHPIPSPAPQSAPPVKDAPPVRAAGDEAAADPPR